MELLSPATTLAVVRAAATGSNAIANKYLILSKPLGSILDVACPMNRVTGAAERSEHANRRRYL